MAHELTINGGKAEMFYFGEKPWHELGQKVENALTSEEAIKAAGLDWNVVKTPAQFTAPTGEVKAVPGKFVNYREDNNTPLGIVGKDYTIVQNRGAFSFFDAVVGEKAAMYHTAGSLFEGRKIWLLAKLPQDTIVKGVDISKNYLLLTNSHDGTSNLKVLWTSVRVVCNNTLTSALHGVDGKISKMRHTANIGMRVQEVQEFLGMTSGLINRFNLRAEELANKPLSVSVVEEFFARMNLKTLPNESEISATKKKNIREAIEAKIALTGKVTPQIAGTRWALLNGFTDFVDHDKTVRPSSTSDKWADSILFGSGAELKRKALSEVVAI